MNKIQELREHYERKAEAILLPFDRDGCQLTKADKDLAWNSHRLYMKFAGDLRKLENTPLNELASNVVNMTAEDFSDLVREAVDNVYRPQK